MAPTTPGNSRHRQRELRVAKNSEGAQAQGGPLSNNTDRNSIGISPENSKKVRTYFWPLKRPNKLSFNIQSCSIYIK